MTKPTNHWRWGWLSVCACSLLLIAAACKSTPTPEPAPALERTAPPRDRTTPPKPEPSFELKNILGERAEVLRQKESFRRSLKLAFGFEDSTTCSAPPAITAGDIDVHKSLFVHDRATLDGTAGDDGVNFTLRTTLSKLAAQAVSAGATETAESLFIRLWDSQNPSPGVDPNAAHCDLDGGRVNGFPNDCRPSEGMQANDALQMDQYHAIALVNRMDLAHEGWRNCGEHRIVYGRKNASQRNFIIFEAVLPNPRPGCRSACKPVAEFWASLSEPSMTPAKRAEALSEFYYDGLPGFRPVVHIDHLTAKGVTGTYGSSGSGQIRTNQFTTPATQPWTLKEFRLALDCGASPCTLGIIPTMVKVNPFGTLWNQEIADAPGDFQLRAQQFQADFVNQIAGLSGKSGATCPPAGADINAIGYSVDLNLDAAQSQVQSSPDNYLSAYDPGGSVVPGKFRDLVKASTEACGLSDTQIVNRALAQSCAGCHQPAGAFGLTAPGSLGPVMTPAGADDRFPASLGFVHTAESPDGSGVHALSPALLTTFLPARLAFFVDALNEDTCTCKRKFPLLKGDLAQRAREIEKKILDRFEPRIQRELNVVNRTKQRTKVVPRTTLAAAEKRLAALERERDTAIVDALKQEQITVEVVTPDLRVQALKLDAAQRARGNKQEEARLRQAAILEQVRAEPPRRTVTGHFRPH